MDGYFLSKTLTEIALAGKQATVPLLAGGDPTPETLAGAITKFYGDKAAPASFPNRRTS